MTATRADLYRELLAERDSLKATCDKYWALLQEQGKEVASLKAVDDLNINSHQAVIAGLKSEVERLRTSQAEINTGATQEIVRLQKKCREWEAKYIKRHEEWAKAEADLLAARADLKTAGEAMELTILHFQRMQNSGNFLGDDAHEAWTALAKASPFRNGNALAYRAAQSASKEEK